MNKEILAISLFTGIKIKDFLLKSRIVIGTQPRLLSSPTFSKLNNELKSFDSLR